MNYKVNRIGFVNFWLYDEEDYYFCDGKMLLRGLNGSGKTVTMQSFFPLIFDGNKSPERLDPFGSKDRKIEDYLLPENFEHNENTGYIFMEFYKKDEDKYLTIGIGLKAVRNRPTESWGFALTDGRRIGKDFILFKERNLRIPLTKRELQTRIGSGGEFTETIKDYKKMVNKLLFGFENIDLYTEFINLIIQVRSPKLSNSTKPSQLTKILSSVLEPLGEDDLRIMADSIEDMNKYKEKIADLHIEQTACNNIKKYYMEYNKSLLYEKGENYLSKRQEYNNILKKIKENETNLNNKKNLIEELTKKIAAQELEKKDLIFRKNKLEETDLKVITKQLEDVNNNIADLSKSKTTKESEKETKENILLNKQNELKQKQDEIDTIEIDFNDALKEISTYEEEINFDDAKFYLDDLKEQKFLFKQMSSYLNTLKRQIELLSILEPISYQMKLKSEEIKDSENVYDRYNDEIDTLNKKHKEISNNIINIVGDYKDLIAAYFTDNKILKVNDLSKIYEVIDSLDRGIHTKVLDILKEETYKYKDNYKLEISNNKLKMNEYQDKILKLEDDLKDAENIHTKDIDKDTINYLNNQKVAYNYFYELVDFKDIDLNKRKIIESFLLETGVLKAFMSNSDIDSSINFKTLKNLKKCQNNLTKYMIALDTPYKDKVQNILESISIDNDDSIKILENGKYEFALIDGQVNLNYELKYIGENVRKEYIANLKEKINISIREYKRQIENLKEENRTIENKLNLLDIEFNNLPKPNNLDTAFEDLDKINHDITLKNDDITKITNTLNLKNRELDKLKEQFNQSKKGYYGSMNYETLKDNLDNINAYNAILESISKMFDSYNNKMELLNSYKSYIEDMTIDLDNLNAELDSISYKLLDYKNKEKNLNDILHNEYKDVEVEYKTIKNKLDEIEKEIPKLEKSKTVNETENVGLEKDIANYKVEIEKVKLLKDVLEQIFIDEYNLGYVKDGEIKENEIYNFVKEIKTNVLSQEALDKFSNCIMANNSLLTNYAPKTITLHNKEDNVYLDFTNNKDDMEIINNEFRKATRMDLQFNYIGRNVNLFTLSSEIDKSISDNENLLTAENTHLFRELLLNNMGSAIRNKIYQSEIWIGEVKKLMESMNISSGLKFSLKWDGVQSSSEDELDTKEIVSIFKKDAIRLIESDYEKISNHFETKIKNIEDALEESERNYLEIIKNVLDYRKWFEFKIYFSRNGSDKKELTDKQFNKMSGGEKAIAMYIPLFSCVYAKLNGAYEYAPRIVALDEAFAGVDDGNMRDAFRILSELNLDYIMTSQSIWGDYDTVKHLAINELYHPVGSNVVTSVKYKWDGIKRERVNDVNEFETI